MAKDTVKAMLDHMTNKQSFTSMTFDDTKDVVVLINNLGSVTNLEMGIITNEVISQLEGKPHNLNILRMYQQSSMQVPVKYQQHKTMI